MSPLLEGLLNGCMELAKAGFTDCTVTVEVPPATFFRFKYILAEEYKLGAELHGSVFEMNTFSSIKLRVKVAEKKNGDSDAS